MELPASWHLKVKHDDRGKAVIMGKDDAGRAYTVRRCDTVEPTERDVSEIADADRERYPNLQAGARSFVAGLVADGDRKRAVQEQCFLEDLEDGAGPIVRAGLGREGSTTGYTRAFARNYEKAFGEN